MTNKQAQELDSRTTDPRKDLIDEIMELAYLYGEFSAEGEFSFREELTKYLKSL